MRVLIICPQFAPNNTADSHRVRLVLPYLQEAGCDVEILAVDPRDVRGPLDPWLAERLPKSIAVHRIRAWRLRGWGLNGLAQRAGIPLYWAGRKLLSKRSFDLVFFSTTRFHLHVLGCLWQSRFSVPFCLDYQDPWVNNYYRERPEITPPGGRVKFGISDWLHRLGERYVVPRCSGFLSVSQNYLDELLVRYGSFAAWQPRLVQPFPGEPSEFLNIKLSNGSTEKTTHDLVIRYIGRGGQDMLTAARAFFAAWQSVLEKNKHLQVKLHFEAIGTAYYSGSAATQTFEPLATEFGLEKWVAEQPLRLSYHATLRSLLDSDALVVFGSDDPSYTASKIYPYLLAKRPLLALFHKSSSVVSIIADVGGGQCVTFDETGFTSKAQAEIELFFTKLIDGEAIVPLDSVRFEKYSARTQARHLAAWFDQVIRKSAQLE